MTTTEEFTEEQVLNQIRLFSERVRSSKPHTVGEYPDGEIDGEFSNRGNKHKLGSTKVHRDRVNGFNNDVEDSRTVYYNNVQRSVIKRRKLERHGKHGVRSAQPDGEEEVGDEDEDDDLFYPEDDPYLQIDLLKLLAPIQQPSELVNRESISKTYKSNVLSRLAQQAIEIIEKEQDTVIELSSLLDIFLCEDTNQLLEVNLQLPSYDHSFNTPGSTSPKAQGLGIETTKDSTTEATDEPDLDKRITRRQSTHDNTDPFFALPSIQMDPDFGLNPEDAEEARQLSQIALQRNEEFIRNLMNLRNGLSRAQYVKEKLFNWAKELNGDPDESDLYQKEVSTGKDNNGAISVTNGKGNLSSFNISGVGGSKDDDSAAAGSSNNSTPVPDAKSSAPTVRKSGRRGGAKPASS